MSEELPNWKWHETKRLDTRDVEDGMPADPPRSEARLVSKSENESLSACATPHGDQGTSSKAYYQDVE